VPVPFGVVTLTAPLAPVPTIAVIPVAESTTKEEAATPPNLTEVVPVKFVPEIVTDVPFAPEVGVNDDTVGTRLDPITFLRIETLSVEPLAEAMSGLPSASISPTATNIGYSAEA